MKGHKIMNYKHISINKRFYITNFLNLGQSIRKISKHLNRNASTISRKNYINEKYLAHIANEAYINNKMNCEAKGKSSNNKLIDALCQLKIILKILPSSIQKFVS